MTVESLEGWPSLPPPNGRWALFLDVDDALLDLRPTPDEVVAPAEVIELLGSLLETFDGAVALLSGRSLVDLDRIFAPLRLPCAGVHGCERRSANGRTQVVSYDRDFIELARAVLEEYVARRPGTLLENKGLALALHTRAAPQFYGEAAELIAWLAGVGGGDFGAQLGKCVAELKPFAANKGVALSAFLQEAPFRGRRPVVTGDDLTDADAFRAALLHDGMSIAIGSLAPSSMYRLESPGHCRRWLAELAKRVAA